MEMEIAAKNNKDVNNNNNKNKTTIETIIQIVR